MPACETLQRKNAGILRTIASLGAMRKGSVCEQFQYSRREDGTRLKRGPYLMYTCKKKGKTLGKRLSKEKASLYRAQIERFRRFQELCREFADGSEQLADMEVSNVKGSKKNSSNASRQNRKRKRAGSSRG